MVDCLFSDVATSAGGATCDQSFLTGAENRRAVTVCGRLSSPAIGGPACLYMWGDSGVGKSHLARAIHAAWQHMHGTPSAQFFAASDLRRTLNDAIGDCSIANFTERVRGLQLLVVEDIHRLPGDAYLDQFFINTFDALAENRGHLVITSKEPPAQLHQLSDALVNRLSAGATVAVSPPGKAARVALAHRSARQLDCRLPDDVAELIAQEIVGTAPIIQGVINDMVYATEGAPPFTHAAVARFLADRHQQLCPRLPEILRVVARYYGLTQKVIKSSCRQQSVAFARAVVVYLARELAGLSFARIGRGLSGRDHTTIIHSYRKIEKLVEQDLATKQALDDLRRLIVIPG